MNNKKVLKLLGNLKRDIAALENELNNISELKDTATKRDTFIISYNGNRYGGKNGYSKRDTFKFIVKNLAKAHTLKQLNKIFDKKLFPKTGNFSSYDYVIESGKEKHLSKSTIENYLPLNTKSKDGKEILVYGEWAEFENKKSKTDGNFPVLISIANKYGFKITKLEK